MSKVYVVGFKHWAEIRAYSKKPKREVDEVKKVLIDQKLDSRSYKYVPTPTNWTCRVIRYPGGRVLYTRPIYILNRLGIDRIGKDKCVQLTQVQLVNLVGQGYTKLKKYIVEDGNGIG
jgi:hypothetical protein